MIEPRIVYSPRYNIGFLGGLNVTAAGVLKRDRFVIEQLTSRGIPTAIVLSGGYSRESYMLVAEMVAAVIEMFGRK